MLDQAQKAGKVSICKRILAVLAVSDETPYSVIAATLKVSKEAIRLWVNSFLLKGLESLKSKKPSGRPPKLTKTQKNELESLIIEGPHKSRISWRMLAQSYDTGTDLREVRCPI